MPKPVIRHVTPHLNGGLGRVMLSTLRHGALDRSAFRHEIVVTDAAHLTDDVRSLFRPFADRIHVEPDPDTHRALLADADIVQLEWWNHPLIYRWMLVDGVPPARLIVCCHVAGLARPNVVTRLAVDGADVFLLANRTTANHPVFADPGAAAKIRTVVYPVDTERLGAIARRPHDGFAVGYVGTLDYAKLHPAFLSMSAAADIPNARFVVCGPDHDNRLEREAKAVAPGLFEFRGFVESVGDVLGELDVFGYPLAPGHFGSGEQALIEAMYAGLPVVVFSNPAEREIVAHGETGLLVDDEAAYARALEFLYRNPSERNRLGRAARAHVMERLSPERCFADLDGVYSETLELPKRERRFRDGEAGFDAFDPALGARLFVASLGDTAGPFRVDLDGETGAERRSVEEQIAAVEPAMTARTKGSLFQYLYFFPDDPVLNRWAGLVDRRLGNEAQAAACLEKAVQAGGR